ncbi:MAG: hypothetical protein HY043_09995 [Verrucomicrobia bacterium]|nr:hypothetical protein [Verrucomicrobiota bacterium]
MKIFPLVLVGVALLLQRLISFGTTEVLQKFDAISCNGTNVFVFTGTNVTSLGSWAVPPDTHGAVGPNGILSTVNWGMAYYPKTGATNLTPIWSANFVNTNSGFWAFLPGYTAGGIADPKVMFDPDSQRFFVIMQENPNDQSFLDVAVSRNSDPRSSSGSDWLFYRWNVTERWDFPVVGEVEVGIDYPGMLVDKRTLTVSYNVFTLDEIKGLNGAENVGARVYVFDKQKLLSGQGDQPRSWRNSAPFDLPLNANITTTIQPAQPIGKSDPGNRIFAVEMHLKFPYFLDQWAIRLHTFNDPLGEFNHQDEDMDVDIDRPPGVPAGAPQPVDKTRPLTAAPIDIAALKPISACFFDGKVWMTYAQYGDKGNSIIHWLAVQPRTADDGGSVIIEDGYVDAGAGVWTYMPTLSAGPRGDLCLIYTQSSTNEAPATYFILRPAGSQVWETPVRLQASTSSTMSFDSVKSLHRWGDYAAVVTDPVDDTFWVSHEYVNTGGTNTWTTFWAQIAACHWPVIPFQPQSITTTACVAQVSFSVSVRSVGADPNDPDPPGINQFTWRHNGTAIAPDGHFLITSNNLGSTLTILRPGYADEGWYDVKVVNECGDKYAVVSKPASLLITPLPSWATIEPRSIDPQPLNRFDHKMVYDQERRVTLMFGGEVYEENVGRFTHGDTWTWDGSRWSPRSPALSPPSRQGFGMTCDSRRKRVVLFGGRFFQNGTNVIHGDTWEWDGSNWQLRAAAGTNTPPARAYPTMAYDSARGETILIGGDLLDPADVNKTWAWNGTNWLLRSTRVPSGGAAPFTVYTGNAMAFDDRRGIMVLFGPFFGSDNLVWEWDGSGWLAVAPPILTPFDGVGDSRNAAAFYDPQRGMVACVGGNNGASVWCWDGRKFYRFDAQLDGIPSPPTVFPFAAGVAFDTDRRALVWSGGGQEFLSFSHRTREIRFADGPVIIQSPADTSVEPGQVTTLHAAVSGAGPLTYQWRVDGAPVLPNDRISGVSTPTLAFNPAQAIDSGHYSLLVAGPCGTISSAQARLAIGPFLNLGRVGNGFRLTWVGTNVIVEEAMTPLGPWIPRPSLVSPFDLPVGQLGAGFYRLRTLIP